MTPISASSARRGSRLGFTLIELLVVIGIVTVLMALLMPALRKARDMSNRAACMSNMRQLNAAATAYRLDHRQLPPSYRTLNDAGYPAFIFWKPWMPYLQTRDVWRCPGGRPISDVPNPDGNWAGPMIEGSYFYVGGLRKAISPPWPVWNVFGSTPALDAANEKRICKDINRAGAGNQLLVTEGVELIGAPDWVFFSHSEIGFGDMAPSYEGFHVYVNASRLKDISGFHRGYADGHVEWYPADERLKDVQTLWNVDYTYTHWVWARWFW